MPTRRTQYAHTEPRRGIHRCAHHTPVAAACHRRASRHNLRARKGRAVAADSRAERRIASVNPHGRHSIVVAAAAAIINVILLGVTAAAIVNRRTVVVAGP